jgi:nitrile hydratase subunit beta
VIGSRPPGTRPARAGVRRLRYCRPVSRVHDIGGQTGFGPVPVADGSGEFHADWEARVWALQAVLRRRGFYNGDEFRDAIERIPPAQYLEASYFERWLVAIEMLLNERAVP